VLHDNVVLEDRNLCAIDGFPDHHDPVNTLPPGEELGFGHGSAATTTLSTVTTTLALCL